MDNSTKTEHVLVVADIWCQIDGLCDEVRERLGGDNPQVMVIAPPLTSRLHTFTSDTDRETAQARQRLEDVLARLRRHGVDARGRLGAHDPTLAIDDALAEFAVDKILVVTDSPGHENWREQRLPAYLDTLGLPVTHFLVPHDLAK